MKSDERRKGWRGFAVVTVSAVLLSAAMQDTTLGGWVAPVPQCNDTAPMCNGTCPAGQTCEGRTRGGVTECNCQDVGCCLNSSACTNGVTALTCLGASGSWIEDGTCGVQCVTPSSTPTATATGTATSTPTNTPIPNGGSCVDPADCLSGNCVDDVCCDTACAGPQEACNLPGNEGVCTLNAAAAPAASRGGLVALVAALATLAVVALWRRRVG